MAELDRPLEALEWSRLEDRFRIALLLGHFGYVERAVALAYRLYLEYRDASQAWLTLSQLVLDQGRSENDASQLWHVDTVSPGAAVDVLFEDGEKLFLIIEPDAKLRQLDDASWEPEHPFVQALLGLRANDHFLAGGTWRPGAVVQIRHKYVARSHFIVAHLEERFPQVHGFRRLDVDLGRPDGLNPLLKELKAHRDWVEQEQEQYVNGPWSLALFAQRVGVDTIEGDCQDFRVWAGIVGAKECHYVATQGAGDPG